MRYVVTGAAGFIGSHLAEALQRAGHEVVGIDSFTDYYDIALKERNAQLLQDLALQVRRRDLARDELDFAGVDGVFHLAGQPGVRSFGDVFPLYVERNVLASQRVFEAAAAAGARVVFASSSSIYGEAERYPTAEDVPPRPVSPYGVTKLACEHLARAYATSFGLDAVVLRYFNAYGPRQRPDMAFPRILDALASREPFALFGDGEQSRSFTFVADVVAASLLAMDRAPSGATYNVGGGEEATMNEALALAERISGRTLDVERTDAAAGDVRRTRADVTKARVELGWVPGTSLEAGLAAQWEWASLKSPA
jgi:UDP-glucuronate 4-epimerase